MKWFYHAQTFAKQSTTELVTKTKRKDIPPRGMNCSHKWGVIHYKGLISWQRCSECGKVREAKEIAQYYNL